MRAKEFTPGHETKARFVEMFGKFLPLAMKYLELKRLPKMVFQTSIHDEEQPTFGRYVEGENTLYVGISNRHPVDILRTVAHELQHYKQDTEHKLHDDSGETGSPEENEAHAMAGIVMRHFNKMYPEYLKDRPVISESQVEAKYSGNLGVMELIKFFKDRPDLKAQYDEIKAKQGAVEALKFALKSINAELEGEPYQVAEDFLNPFIQYKSRGVAENFADGRNPQDKGYSKRYNVPTKGSISSLRKIAKQGGRRGQLAHWMANMKSGKSKKK